MDRLNSHFLRPSATRSRAVSGHGQSALVDKLGTSSADVLYQGPHRYHPGIVQQAQGRSYETAVSPHHTNQSTIHLWTSGQIAKASTDTGQYKRQTFTPPAEFETAKPATNQGKNSS
jgi:hypothetical protein